MRLDFGVHLGLNQVGDPAPDRLAYYEQLLAIGEGALSALWVSDHLQKDDAPVLEAWTTLTYLAALAPSFRVGHLVLSQSYRNPALLAKMAATLQMLTGGRFVLGLGAGWQADEYHAYGFPFPSAGERIAQLGEAIDLIRAMWSGSPASYAGRHYRVEGAHCEPRPEPHPPILVGGQGQKVMRMVAEKADAWHWDGPIEIYRPPYDRLAAHCETIGRDISKIKLLAGIEVYFPADSADFPQPYWSGYENFMTTPFGPTPADAIAMMQPMIELGVTEFTVIFWDSQSARSFVDKVIPAMR
ncbi:MAG: LLM class flavin-dependent oxidoreductase [Jatrophihabitans sp.]|uniref:LLM class flavin-dependent oxidoreductase n=1 Tax=Jatrophihabitans sp. TaxID=1932789 RepID=UPI003912F7BD